MNSFHDHPDDPVRSDPTLAALVERLDARGRRLSVRDGLTERVLAAVERERLAPTVAGRIERSAIRRWVALAASLLLMVGGLVVAMLVLRGDRGAWHDPAAPMTLTLAEASPAERLLVALADESVPGAAAAHREIIEEILPGAAVQYDELDQELKRILGAAGANGAATR